MESKEKKRLEFRFGMVTLLIPFLIMFGGIILLALSGKAFPMAFWLPTLLALFAALLLAKKPTQCAEVMIRGMANEMVAIMLMAWFIAGIIAQLLKASGLIDSLVWLCVKVGLSGGWFPVVVFIIGCVLSTSTGTALGTVIALAPVLGPVGLALGSNMPVLLGAIVGGAYFGDNIAPVSDTTIASAYTQGVEVAAVVKSRLKYAIVAGVAAIILFIIFGNMGTAAGATAGLANLSPNALVMLVIPVLLIIMMFSGANLIVALMTSGFTGIVLALLMKFITFKDVMFVNLETFSVEGIISGGIMGMIDIAVFAFLLMGLIRLLDESGLLHSVIEKLSKMAKSARSAELWVAFINIILNILTVASTIVIVMEGPLAKKLLVGKYNIVPSHSANMLDAVAAGAMCLIPYGFAPLLAVMFCGTTGISVFSVCLNSFYGYTLLIVMLIAILTGWGRKFVTPAAAKELMEDENKVLSLKELEAITIIGGKDSVRKGVTDEA
jgi:Na+/H+ antiporter NhaC